MKPTTIPMTNAIRALNAAKVKYEARCYDFTEHGGTIQAATELGLDHHATIKTIILEDETKKPFVCLMHGDREISTKNLARALGEKSVELCERAEAERHSGYHCGGTSPFGFRRPGVPVYAQPSIFDLDWICINGGQRGFFVKIDPALLKSILGAMPLDAEQAPPPGNP